MGDPISNWQAFCRLLRVKTFRAWGQCLLLKASLVQQLKRESINYYCLYAANCAGINAR